METVKLSTEEVELRSRLAYWTDSVCDSFVELDCVSMESDRFFGSLENTSVADVQFSRIVAAAQCVSRRKSNIGRSNRDYFLLSLQTAGQGIIEQDGRIAILRPGDLALYDTTRAYDLRFLESFGQIVLRLPRSLITRALAASNRMTAVRIEGNHGAGLLASKYIVELHDQIGNVAAENLARLNAITIDLVSAALCEQVETVANLTDARFLMQQRINNFVEANLVNPSLNCEVIAARHQMSERYLRKIFEGSSLSLSELIWARRLERARRDLADPMKRHLSISSIGYGVGFKDTAHFSRAFKARFGMTPRDARSGSTRRAP